MTVIIPLRIVVGYIRFMLPELTQTQLAELKNTSNAKQIASLLQRFSGLDLKNSTVIKNYHDALLYYSAFPPTNTIYLQAGKELVRLASIVKNITHSAKKQALYGSGIAHTSICCAFSSCLCDWLVHRFPGAVQFHSSGAGSETAKNVMQALLPGIEFEKSAYDEPGLAFRLKKVSGIQEPGEQLKWLLKLFAENKWLPLVKEELYRQLDVFVQWQINDAEFNRGALRWPTNHVFCSEEKLKNFNCLSVLQEKPGKPISLSAKEKSRLMDTMKASLAFYCRETDPFTYAHPEELLLFDTGRGVQIALAGMVKEKRLSLETYIGYMAFKNGMPVAYGGGWLWGNQCKIGINIYPPFRSGESAWIFCQVMRVYHQYFNIDRFIVKPYQFGKGNTEGLKSGASWFYYKIGFRPVQPEIRLLADGEWAKIKSGKNYRTPLSVMRRFTRCNMEWVVNPGASVFPDAEQVSAAVSAMINKVYNASRQQAINTCMEQMGKSVLFAPVYTGNNHELRVIENWGLLSGLLNHLSGWTKTQKRTLIKIIRLKQSGGERAFLLHLQRHKKLWQSLAEQLNGTGRKNHKPG